jgi:hypothetical protein
MLDRLQEFRDLAKKEDVDRELTEALFNAADLEAQQKDRNEISNFMDHFHLVLKEINSIEKNNIEMRKIFTHQIIENKRADGEIKTEGMNTLMKENGDRQKSVKV